jgi:outer membrane protein assembly factor BamA
MIFILSKSPTLGQQKLTPMRLIKIEVSGIERFTAEDVIKASELKIGQLIDIPTLDKAAERLLESGLFERLSYRYRSMGDNVTVTFQVEELGGGIPVVFDNFVWFTQDELKNEVIKEIPAFDGTIPETQGALNGVTKALERLIQDRKIAGKIEYIPSVDTRTNKRSYLFSVKGAEKPICQLHFTNTKKIEEKELLKVSQPLLERPYSLDFTTDFMQLNLIPLYIERGHLRASIDAPIVQLDTNSKCNGVKVEIPINEGSVYYWNGVDWTGNRALSNHAIEESLGMKTGEIANGVKIEKGLEEVKRAYKQIGFISVQIKNNAPELDDTNYRARYNFSIKEGAQYRMGKLNIVGIPQNQTQYIREGWKLEEGSIYNDSYPNEFMKNWAKTLHKYTSQGMKLSISQKGNPQTKTVDITLNFTPNK